MSPHPIEMQTSPSRSSPARNETRSSRRGSHTDATGGIGFGDGIDDQLAGDARDRNGAGCVDVGQHDQIGARERERILLPHLLDAVIPVRLEHRHDALPRVATVPCGPDHGIDLRRQVRVVVDEGRPAVDPAHVEASGDSTEAGECSGDVVERDADAQGHGRGTVALTTLWIPRSGKRDLAEEFGGPVDTTAGESESERPGGRPHVDSAHVALGTEPVGDSAVAPRQFGARSGRRRRSPSVPRSGRGSRRTLRRCPRTSRSGRDDRPRRW